jgi:hypothetical protein
MCDEQEVGQEERAAVGAGIQFTGLALLVQKTKY